MLPTLKNTFLLASHEPALLAAVEPTLAALDARIQILMSAEAALSTLTDMEAVRLPALALIDTRLPGLDIGRLLAASRAADLRFPIVLFSDTVSEESRRRLDEGVLDDLLPTNLSPDQLSLRIDMILRARRREKELAQIQELLARNDRTDRLTGAFTREALLSLLFRETDRVQRMNTTLCIILFDIDDFGHWNAQLGSAACDQLLVLVSERVSRLLRSYDLLGRVGKDEFLAGLPGCAPLNAVLLAERMRNEVFATPFSVGGTAVRLTACFGIAPSNGRSPVLVLREAEDALRIARETGPESIQCAAGLPHAKAAPTAFLTADDQFAW